MRQMRQRLLGRRVEDLLTVAAVAVDPFAVDIEREIGVHERLILSLIAEMGVTKGLAPFRTGFTPPAAHAGLSHMARTMARCRCAPLPLVGSCPQGPTPHVALIFNPLAPNQGSAPVCRQRVDPRIEHR